MFPGGIADKLGNQYEAKWLVRQLLDVIAGKAEWLRFEGITPQFDGFECAVSRGRVTEWHQTKINAPNGNWTVNALKREYVLGAFVARDQAHDQSLVALFTSTEQHLFRLERPPQRWGRFSGKLQRPLRERGKFSNAGLRVNH